jgi:hypothetical protein
MATVTVLGASGVIGLPFASSANAALAQQLASQISAAIQNHVTFANPANTPVPDPLPAGYSNAEQVIGGNTPTIVADTNQTVSGNAAVFINNAANSVTITGGGQAGPFSLLAGTGGTTFDSGATSGTIFLGGGNNVITGPGIVVPGLGAAPGLQGDWLIGTGGGPAGSDLIQLATGNDTVLIGANDTVNTGFTNALITANNTDNIDPVVSLGSGNDTFYGALTGGDSIFGAGVNTGTDYIQAGLFGNSTVWAGTGATTLSGGGNGDILFADSSGGTATQYLFAAGGNETLDGIGAAGNDLFVGFNSINAVGNVAMNASNASGNELFWAGAGNDTIWTGLGNDSVVFTQHITALSGGTGQDTVVGWNAKDTLITFGYGLNPGTMTNIGPGGSIVLTFSDGTRLTFAGVTDPAAIKLLSD